MAVLETTRKDGEGRWERNKMKEETSSGSAQRVDMAWQRQVHPSLAAPHSARVCDFSQDTVWGFRLLLWDLLRHGSERQWPPYFPLAHAVLSELAAHGD